MNAMRSLSRIFAVAALAAPLLVAAAAPDLPSIPRSQPLQGLQPPAFNQAENETKIPAPPAVPSLCANTTVGVSNRSVAFPMSQQGGDQLKKYVSQIVHCGSVCINEDIRVSIKDTFVVIETKVTPMCGTAMPSLADAKKNNRGCAKGQTQPTVTVYTPAFPGVMEAKVIGPKSRCNPAVSSSLTAALTRFGPSTDYGALQDDLSKLDKEPAVAPPATNAGTEALTKALTNFGVDQTQAQALASTDPKSAAELIAAFESQDAKKITDTAQAAGVTLNPSTVSDAVALTPQQVQDKLSPLTEGTYDWRTADVRGFDTGGDGGSGVADRLSPLCGYLGGCGQACEDNPGRLTCRTNNPGALTCGGNAGACSTIAARYGGFACGQSNNTACFPSLEQGLAAQAALLTGSRYFGGANPTILSAICNAYASNSAGNDCAAYASFVSRYSGIPMTQTIDPRNSEQVGRIMMAMSRYEHGNGVMFTPQQLEGALKMAYGGLLPPGTPGFTPTFMPGTGASGVRFGSPFDITSGGYPAGYYSLGSPFAQVNPAPIGYGAQPTLPQTVQQPSGANAGSPAQPSGQQGAGSVQGGSQRPQQATYGGPAALTLIAQPEIVQRGSSALLTWSSVGMRASPACVLMQGTFAIAQANNGSKRITITRDAAAGDIRFTLRCTTLDGTAREATTTIEVR